MARSCALRSFAAAIIFIALVICRVLLTLRMRLRKSRMLGMPGLSLLRFLLLLLVRRELLDRRLLQRRIAMLGEKILLVFRQRALDPVPQIIVQRLLLQDVFQQPGL